MFLWQMFRMLADLSFYYIFAGFAANLCGISVQIWKAAVFGLCFGYAAQSRKKGSERIAAVLAVVFLVWPGTLPEAVVHFPAVCYLIAEMKKKDYGLSWYRQIDNFRRSLFVIPIFFLGAIIFGFSDILPAVSVPMTVIFLTASVLLLRSLRHCGQIQRDREFQAENLMTAGLILGAVWLIRLPVVLNTCKRAMGVLYTFVLLPILSAVIWMIGGLATGIFYGFLWLLRAFGLGETERSQLLQKLEGMGGQSAGPPVWAQGAESRWIPYLVFSLVFLAVLIAGVVLFIRWMMRKEPVGQKKERAQELIFEEGLPAGRSKGKRESSGVRGIRRQYRKFLRYFCSRGGVMRNSKTSQEIAEDSLWSEKEREATTRLTELYRKARYGYGASPEDRKEAERILRRLRGRK